MNTFAACFSRVFYDEAHIFKSSTTQVIGFIKNLNMQFKRPSGIKENPKQRPFKWLISDTTIDTSPGDYEGSMSTLQRVSWDHEESPFHYCKSQTSLAWGRAFQSFLDGKDKGQQTQT